MAHHSFAMFDNENQIGIEGVVQEFKYTSPHTFILLEVKAQDGSITVRSRRRDAKRPGARGMVQQEPQSWWRTQNDDCAIAQRRAGGAWTPRAQVWMAKKSSISPTAAPIEWSGGDVSLGMGAVPA